MNRIAGKLRCLALFIMALTAVVLSSPALAQGDREDLILNVLPSNFGNEVKVGEDNRLFLELRNNGTRPVTQIRLSSEQPGGWLVEFRPSEISSLGARSVQTVDVIIRPDSRATKGNYTVTIIAEAVETRRVTEVFLTIKTSSSLWIWIGASVVAVLIAVFVLIFLRLGRQKI